MRLAEIRSKQMGSSGVAELMTHSASPPVKPQAKPTAKKRDFCKENYVRLKKLEKEVQSKPVPEESEPFKLRKFKNVPSRINSRPSSRPGTASSQEQQALTKDFVRLNMRIKKEPNTREEPKTESIHKLGFVPKYIIERKQMLAEAQIQHEVIPEGMRLLDDAERIDTLEFLKQEHEKLMNEIAKLPVASTTAAFSRRKSGLEQRLEQLESRIEIFSKPKVFIQLDSVSEVA